MGFCPSGNGIRQQPQTILWFDEADWYIDGGPEADHDSILTCISYAGLEPMRVALLRRIHSETQRLGMGPEALRTIMVQLRPIDLSLTRDGDDILECFQLKLLTEGSGTQLFSTSFAHGPLARCPGAHSHSRC